MSEYVCKAIAGPLEATVSLPGSKSITNRVLIAAALADGHSLLKNALLAEDTWLMIEALRALGICVTVDEGSRLIEVTGCKGHIPESEASLFCGNSGTTIRFCTALAALGQGRYELDGIARMRQRPIGGLVSALQRLGAAIEYLGQDGYPPLVVHARGLRGGEVILDSPESSQMVSALMLAAPCARSEVMIEVAGDLPSTPYVRMTAEVMQAFGVGVLGNCRLSIVDCRLKNTERVSNAEIDHRPSTIDDPVLRYVIEAPQRYAATNYAIEPDASNATYFWAAPAIAGGRVTVEGLGTASIQGDVRFVDVLEQMGCGIEREPDRISVDGPAQGPLRGIEVDLNDMPDTAPTLAVVALFASGPTTIRNVASLRVKETDRLAALARELRKLGAKVTELPDGLVIQPPPSSGAPQATSGLSEATVAPLPSGPPSRHAERSEASPGVSRPVDLEILRCAQDDGRRVRIETYNDHRMAMSFALAGLRIAGVVLDNPGCVGKTFPEFFSVFEAMMGRRGQDKLGAR